MQAIDNKHSSIHEANWRELLSLGLDRLPHALLLSGAPGLGKQQFAERLLDLLLGHRRLEVCLHGSRQRPREVRGGDRF